MADRFSKAQLEKSIRAIVADMIAQKARPWEPISDEYLSSKEMLVLMGIDPKSNDYQYREFLKLCEMAAAQPNGDNGMFPTNMRNCFIDCIVRVVPFKGRLSQSNGPKIEYRIEIADLNSPCRTRALGIVLSRPGTTQKLTRKSRLFLAKIALTTNRSVWQVIEDLVVIEMAEQRLSRLAGVYCPSVGSPLA